MLLSPALLCNCCVFGAVCLCLQCWRRLPMCSLLHYFCRISRHDSNVFFYPLHCFPWVVNSQWDSSPLEITRYRAISLKKFIFLHSYIFFHLALMQFTHSPFSSSTLSLSSSILFQVLDSTDELDEIPTTIWGRNGKWGWETKVDEANIINQLNSLMMSKTKLSWRRLVRAPWKYQKKGMLNL